MGEAKEIRISEYEHLHNHPSIQINGYPRDLLQRFRAGNHFTAELSTTTTTTTKMKKSEELEEEGEEEELNLGLSLGSLFGMKGPSENRLVRSSSIAGLTTALFREGGEEEEEVSLIRTCSLPVEPEEDLRKRKEMQSLRRLEAKRKRSEKQRINNCRVKEKEKEKPSSLDEEDDKRAVVVVLPGGGGEEQGLIVNKGFKQQQQQQQYMVSNGFSFRPPNWASPSSQVQRSQGSSSSGTSEIEGIPAHHQGSSSCTEARSPRSVQSLPELSEQKPVVAPTTAPPNAEKSSMFTGVEVENPSNTPKVNDNGSREMGMKMMEEENMPCCWTTGSGPNGKRIEGLLYNYRKGEEVRIVCVCHGSFLTPAEFVKHAGGGGGDVENPLRHITVNLSSSSSF